MRAYERLLRYVKVYTQSADGTGETPSTPCQLELARQLAEGILPGAGKKRPDSEDPQKKLLRWEREYRNGLLKG